MGEYFDFTIDERADAQLQTVGLSLAELQKKGTIAFPEKEYSYGKTPEWKTPTKKVQFASEACVAAGLPAGPAWLEPKVMPKEGEFRLVGGKQAIHTHTQTANIEPLMAITKQYGLDRIWMNADKAAEMGIEDGDLVEVSSSEHTGTTRVKVTQRIEPGSIPIRRATTDAPPPTSTPPTAWACVRWTSFPSIRAAHTGSAMTQEVVVTVKKAGA